MGRRTHYPALGYVAVTFSVRVTGLNSTFGAKYRLSLKRGTGNRRMGTGNGERGIFKMGNL